MDLEKRTEYIKTRLSEKGIDEETQAYVLKYVDMNQQLFGNVIDINKVVDRIVNNLHHSISTYDVKKNPIQGLLKTFSTLGSWEPYNHRIQINPVIKLMSKMSKKVKGQYISTIMHEIDHCATTKYEDIATHLGVSEQKLEQQVKKFGKLYEKAFKNKANKRNGMTTISGIAGVRLTSQDRRNGVNSAKLYFLNEGITAYKQEMYDEFLGIKSSTGYKESKLLAGRIGEIIGKEELIAMHSDNDYGGIKNAFQEKTGQDLNTIVKRLNHASPIMSMMFGKMYTKYSERRIQKIMQSIKLTQKQSNSAKDFIPRHEIDHATAIAKVMEESQSPTHAISTETEMEFND